MSKPDRRSVADWNGTAVAPGEARDVSITAGESYTGVTVRIPLHVRRAPEPGPVVFVTAAIRRTNYPAVRADRTDEAARALADAFGAEIALDTKGPKRSFRREASRVGCPTMILEGGEVWKVEPGVVAASVRGVRNVLKHLGMLSGEPAVPSAPLVVERSQWVRAERGGFLTFHVGPGEAVERRQPLATHSTLLGREQRILRSPFDGVVLGMTTLPAASPGEPVIHLGRLPAGTSARDLPRSSSDEAISRSVADDLATNVLVTPPRRAG